MSTECDPQMNKQIVDILGVFTMRKGCGMGSIQEQLVKWTSLLFHSHPSMQTIATHSHTDLIQDRRGIVLFQCLGFKDFPPCRINGGTEVLLEL